MRDKDKTKQQLLEELADLRRRVAELEEKENEFGQLGKVLNLCEPDKEAILEGITELIAYHDLNLVVLWANKVASESVGLALEDLVGRHCYEIWPHLGKPCPGCPVMKALETGQTQSTEMITPDGRQWFIRGYPVLDQEGQAVGAVEITMDITERKKVEKALKESEERVSMAIEGTDLGLWDWMVQTGETIFNERWANILGYTLEELAPVNIDTWIRLTHPDDLKRSNELLARHFTGESEFYECEARMKHKNGKSVWVLDRGKVVERDADGKPVRMTGTHLDITERKQAEEMFRALADSSPIGIYIVQDGRFQYVNPQMQKQIGYSSRELLGRESLSVVIPEDRGMVRKNAIEMLKGKSSQPYEYRTVDKQGSTEWVLETVASIMYQGQRATLGNQMNITERKRLEDEQLRIEKLESIGTLAGGIAHDFNNILTVIMGNISMAIREVEPSSNAADRLEEAERASHRARDLTHRLLAFARGGDPVKKAVSIAEMVRESAAFGLRGSSVSGNYFLPDDLWAVEADEGQLNQVMTNLVINAVEAMPMGGTLDISARNLSPGKTGKIPLPKGKYVEITVADHGIGMSQAHWERIFEPYFSTKQRGSGLGLATSYSIVKNHGGHITVESELGIGTTFRLYLPASGEPAPARIEMSRELPVTGKGRILVMDDEATIRLLLSKMLDGAGYEVELAENGEEAIKKYTGAMVAGTPFAAVIMDLTISGGMGGMEATNKLREIDSNLKAIVSSGYSTDPIMANYMKYGFSGVVAKPYQAGELEKTLRNVLLSP